MEEMLAKVRQIEIQILLSCVPMILGACAGVSGCRWFYKRQPPIATIFYVTRRIVWKPCITKSISIQILARIIGPIVTTQPRATNDVRSIGFCDVPGVVSVIVSVVCVVEVVVVDRVIHFHVFIIRSEINYNCMPIGSIKSINSRLNHCEVLTCVEVVNIPQDIHIMIFREFLNYVTLCHKPRT